MYIRMHVCVHVHNYVYMILARQPDAAAARTEAGPGGITYKMHAVLKGHVIVIEDILKYCRDGPKGILGRAG